MKKTILLLLVLCAFGYTSKAQLGYNYAQYGLGFNLNSVTAKTDVPNQTSHPSYNFNFNYNYTPYTTFSLEYEFGRLSGGYGDFYEKALKGVSATDANYATLVAAIPIAYKQVDPFLRYYYNDYQSIALHGDVQLGEFIDYENGGFIARVAKNIYVGSGVGMVYNKIVSINRFNADSTYVYGGSDRSNNIFVPVRVGYQFKIYNSYDEPSISVNFGYQMNYVFGYGLDGYSDPQFTTRDFERFGGFHVGIKFNFGDVTSYRKAIH